MAAFSIIVGDINNPMIYLLHYDRPNGKLVSIQEFPSTHRKHAMNARLELELDLHHKGLPHEATLLEAASVEALRRTHGRYFYTSQEILEKLSEVAKRAGKAKLRRSVA
jgi:hypothetical protein